MGKRNENEDPTDHVNRSMDETVAQRTTVEQQNSAITKLGLQTHTAFIEADPYIANPYALLGMVLQIRKQGGKCPDNLANPNYLFEFTSIPIKRKVDESSKLKEPKIRSSIVVDKNLAASVSFLSYLSSELTDSIFFSLMVFDQAAAIIDQHDPEWPTNINIWKQQNQDLLNDSEICYLFGITGFIQKNIVRKKYVKFKAGAKGGAYGLNVDGELSTSTDEYSLDIKFGLIPAILKRPTPPAQPFTALAVTPTKEELSLFGGLTGSTMQHNRVLKKLE